MGLLSFGCALPSDRGDSGRELGETRNLSPFDLHLPRLRFPTYGFLATGSPRLTGFLAPLSPAKLPVSYPFFLSSPCTNFDPTDFCHLRRRSNLLICLFGALCPGPSSQEDRTLAAWSKKKRNLYHGMEGLTWRGVGSEREEDQVRVYVATGA